MPSYIGPWAANGKAIYLFVAHSEDRDHEYPSLAKVGVKQYKLTQAILERVTGTGQEHGVTAKAELKSEEYGEVADSIQKASPREKPPKRKAQNPPKTEDPEVKQFKELIAKKTTFLRKLKSLNDKVASPFTGM